MIPFALPLILGSQSSRRQELLRDAGYEFEVMIPDPSVEGGLCSGCSPSEMVVQWAVNKANDIAKQIQSNKSSFKTGTILTADTIAEVDGQILGKPRDEYDAERMLRLLSGREHRCLTGICVWDVATREFIQDIAIARLRMDLLSDTDLQDYLDSDQWAGKSGAFGFQDGPDWLHLSEGLATTVVGLPIELVPNWFEQLSAKVS